MENNINSNNSNLEIDTSTRTSTNRKKVIWTCFAGRKHNLSVLLRYVLALIERNIVDECHLWNFTRKSEDERWLKEHFSVSKSQIKVIDVKNKRSWSEYYRHYTKERYDNHIIIKCDDDVVYIDIDQFENFLKNRENSPDSLLAFPSIINNAVCANFQQEAGFLDAKKSGLGEFPFGIVQGRLWGNGCLAERLHHHFIDNIEEYRTMSRGMGVRDVKKGIRISINLFAILSKDLDIFKTMGRDDEHDLTVLKTVSTKRHNHVDLSCFVAHLAFSKQRTTGMNEKNVLERYSRMADELCLPTIQ